ncbi:pyridoxal phosphate-dependent aminotransferase [Candidatus Micrarchaeota archaeon]|nr:pyridoxal phosphate-dependent aminotransferase [Candidatus Micrarchaeota archaeon]
MAKEITSDLSSEIRASPIRQLSAEFEKVVKNASSGPRPISFGLGEPYVMIPESAIKGAQDFLQNASKAPQKYPSNNGMPNLREAISTYLKRFGLNFQAPEILITNGGREAIMLSMLATLNEGDKLIIPSPSWVAYAELAKLRLGKKDILLLPTTLENNFVPTLAQLEATVKKVKGTMAKDRKIVLQLTDPHNPTGAMFPQELKKEIAKLALDHDLLVFSDEIYAGLVEQYKSIATYDGMRDRTIVFGGVAKVFSMTAWGLGFVACPNPNVYNLMNALKGHVSVTPTVTQQAASPAFTDPNFSTYAEKNRRMFIKRAGIVNEWAVRHKLGHSKTAPGMIYSWISVAKSGLNADEFCKKAVELRVLAIPGSGFGDAAADPELNKYIRISLSANEEDLKEGLARLEKLF